MGRTEWTVVKYMGVYDQYPGLVISVDDGYTKRLRKIHGKDSRYGQR